MKNFYLGSIKAVPKTGNENLTFNGKNIGYTLLEFWQWSVSDILSNATRGRFAEFIVGTSVGLNIRNIRNEWDAYDIKTDNGIKIEIKSASYIQSWNQKNYSKIYFSIKSARFWDEVNGLSKESTRHADLYVFCLLKHKNQETINPLNLEQWEFYVLPTFALDKYTRSQTTISLNSLKKLTSGIAYEDLKKEISKAYLKQKEIKTHVSKTFPNLSTYNHNSS